MGVDSDRPIIQPQFCRRPQEEQTMTTPDTLRFVEGGLNYLVPMADRPRYFAYDAHTGRAGRERVRDLWGEGAEELLGGRVRVINLGRPTHGPLQDPPLAVGDAKTSDPADLVASDLVYRHRVGETYSVTYNPA